MVGGGQQGWETMEMEMVADGDDVTKATMQLKAMAMVDEVDNDNDDVTKATMAVEGDGDGGLVDEVDNDNGG